MYQIKNTNSVFTIKKQLSKIKKNSYRRIISLLFITLLISITSCTRDQIEEIPYLEIKQNSIISIEWTAFKFPSFEDRVGVTGSFDSFEYRLTQNTDNILDQLNKSQLTISTNSVNIGNSDTKTSNVNLHFFSYFTSHIDCQIINIDHKNAEISISINGITRHYIFEVEIDKEKRNLVISGGIENLMVFGAQKAFVKLNEVCGIFHEGFVWPDVAINVRIENYDLLN